MKTQDNKLLAMVQAFQKNYNFRFEGIGGEDATTSRPDRYGVAPLPSANSVRHRQVYSTVEERLGDGIVSYLDLAAIKTMVNAPSEAIRLARQDKLDEFSKYGPEPVALLKEAFNTIEAQGPLRTLLESLKDFCGYTRARIAATFY